MKNKILWLLIAISSLLLTACKQDKSSINVDGKNVTYEMILSDVNTLLDVSENGDGREVFYRWENPVRYYVSGLDKQPKIAQEFDDIANDFAKITGVNIKRHDKIYWPSDKTMYHPDSPENHFTNVHLFFYPDFGSLSTKSEYLKVARLLGYSKIKEHEKYKLLKKTSRLSDGSAKPIGVISFSGSKSSLMYYNYFGKKNADQYLNKSTLLHMWLNVLMPLSTKRQSKLKLYLSNRNRTYYAGSEINFFDRIMLLAYYNKSENKEETMLRHHMDNRDSAQIIAKDIWEQYQDKH